MEKTPVGVLHSAIVHSNAPGSIGTATGHVRNQPDVNMVLSHTTNAPRDANENTKNGSVIPTVNYFGRNYTKTFTSSKFSNNNKYNRNKFNGTEEFVMLKRPTPIILAKQPSTNDTLNKVRFVTRIY